jgi:hypothetical protein
MIANGRTVLGRQWPGRFRGCAHGGVTDPPMFPCRLPYCSSNFIVTPLFHHSFLLPSIAMYHFIMSVVVHLTVDSAALSTIG